MVACTKYVYSKFAIVTILECHNILYLILYLLNLNYTCVQIILLFWKKKHLIWSVGGSVVQKLFIQYSDYSPSKKLNCTWNCTSFLLATLGREYVIIGQAGKAEQRSENLCSTYLPLKTLPGFNTEPIFMIILIKRSLGCGFLLSNHNNLDITI